MYVFRRWSGGRGGDNCGGISAARQKQEQAAAAAAAEERDWSHI
jgi:hypothetical protein